MEGNWHETANVVTGILTALFTGLGAWLVWRQQKERITVEWDVENRADGPLLVRGLVRNGTNSTLKVWLLKVDGLVLDVQPNDKELKHSSWAKNQLPLRCEPSPGGSSGFSAKVTPDWQRLHKQQQRWQAKLWTRFARLVWKLSSSSIRIHHGASLHFQITIDSKSDRRFRKRMSERVDILTATIEQRATKIDNQKEDKSTST